MYRLINEWGNRIVKTDNEREKNRLLEAGFSIDKTKKKETGKAAGKSGKGKN